MTRQGKKPTSEVDVADRLHSAAIHILRRLRGEDERSGLTGPQLSALSVIVFGGPITVGDLARAEQVRPPTISRLLKGLERDGLVDRERDAADGRVQRITATERGRRLLHEGRERRVAYLARQIGDLPRDQRHTLASAVEVLESLVRPR
jgi:DNA-binding MarR family transcriptional regulator